MENEVESSDIGEIPYSRSAQISVRADRFRYLIKQYNPQGKQVPIGYASSTRTIYVL